MADVMTSITCGGYTPSSINACRKEKDVIGLIYGPAPTKPAEVKHASSKCEYLQEGGLRGLMVKFCDSSYQGKSLASSPPTSCRSDVPLPTFFACLFSESADRVIASVREALIGKPSEKPAPSEAKGVAEKASAGKCTCTPDGDLGPVGSKSMSCACTDTTTADAKPAAPAAKDPKKKGGSVFDTGWEFILGKFRNTDSGTARTGPSE